MTIKHSKIGASSAKRWMACPGSVRLCEGLATGRSSEYAAEGTAAHAFAEMCLRPWAEGKPLVSPDNYLGQTVENFIVTPNMAEAVNVYVEASANDYQEGDEIEIEVRFDLSEVHTGLFGTADKIRYRESDASLKVSDYKHGAGVAVDVEWNEQLMYYALGAALRLGRRPLRTITLEIVQPRCPHPDGIVREWTIGVDVLIDFCEDLRQAAIRTEAPEALLNPGDHCRWCPASGFCPARRDLAQARAKMVFMDGVDYSGEDLASCLADLPSILQWAKAVNEFAYSEAVAGRIPPGYKLVQKPARRKWRDDEVTAEALKDFGMDDEDIYQPRELKTVPMIEKVYGKKNMKELEELIVMEPTGTTLVPLTDRRPAIARAEAREAFPPLGDDDEWGT